MLTVPGSPFEMGEAVIDGIPQRVWKNAPPTLRDIFVAGRAFGERVFLVHEDERITFEAFARASIHFAHDLIARGIRKGDRVAIVMRNLPEWPVAFFGTLLAGGVATPLNGLWTSSELTYGLKDSGARIAVLDAERYERIAPIAGECPELREIIVARDPASGTINFESIVGTPDRWSSLAARDMPDIAIDTDDICSILYTSGTTGNPKGAMQTHRNSVCAILAAQFAGARNFIRRGEPLPTPDPAIQRSALISVPFFHTTGCHAILCPSLFVGAKLVMMRRFEPVAAMRLIERERITSAGGVPTIAWQIVEHPQRGDFDLSSLESISYGGAPASSDLVRRLRDVFPKSAPGIGWGMTETTSTFTQHSAEDYEHRPESAGPAIAVCDMKVVDDSGQALATGSVGELWVKGPNVVRGYWNKPDANAQTFSEGWLKTGDLARIDDEGFLFIVDRKKDMLIRGGENIYCIEVENVLYDHPAVMDAALIGLPHKTLGEEPAAVVMVKPDMQIDEAELRAFLAARLASFKVPVRFAIIADPLPRNANGKIMKPALRELFA